MVERHRLAEAKGSRRLTSWQGEAAFEVNGFAPFHLSDPKGAVEHLPF